MLILSLKLANVKILNPCFGNLMNQIFRVSSGMPVSPIVSICRRSGMPGLRGLLLFKNSRMNKLILCLFTYMLIISCNNYYTLSSPDGSYCVTFEEVQSVRQAEPIVNLYINNAKISEHSPHLRMRWSNTYGIMINWKSKPIKIRSFLIRSNSLDSSLYDVKADMTKEEEKEFSLPGSGWKEYNFVDLRDGDHKRCGD